MIAHAHTISYSAGRKPVLALIILLAVAGACQSGCDTASRPDDADKGLLDVAPLQAAITSVSVAAVVVEYEFRYDKADSPSTDGGGRDGAGDLDSFVRDERPVERPGFLIAPAMVLTGDMRVHPRFIASIRVRPASQFASGGKPTGMAVEASLDSVAADRSAMRLKLAGPLAGATPLAPNAEATGPYVLAVLRENDGIWSVGSLPAGSGGLSNARGKPTFSLPAPSIIVGKDGVPVAPVFSREITADESWRTPAAQWPWVSAVIAGNTLDAAEKTAASVLPRVSITFRSPRQDNASRARGGDEGAAERDLTEWNGAGVVLDSSRVLVLASFKPKTTARLQSIRIHVPGSQKAIEADFDGSLKQFGGFVAKLRTPALESVKVFDADIATLRDTMVIKADIGVLGETRTAYFSRDRISDFFLSYRRQVMPSVAAARISGRRSATLPGNFLFTTDGKLVTVPIERRDKVTVERDFGDAPIAMPLLYVLQSMGDKVEGFEQQNRPLSEAEENRLAWVGVELQSMDPDLARLNNVADQTGGGRTGGIVTFVYPDSPASRAGVAVGDILLRLHVTGQPKPLEVIAGENTGFGAMMDRFWAQVDEIPDDYFDRLPWPWGSAESPLTRSLTDIGFGTPFKADIFRDGKVLTRDFTVEQGPAHFEAAARIKHEASGISARDLTFEVRRYFQIAPAEAGVIVSRVEKGSRAAIAGIKPYEIITSVEDQPINTVAELEAAFAKGGEVKVSVKRMTEGRTVKVKLK